MSRAPIPPIDPAAIALQLAALPELDRLRALSLTFAEATPDTIAAILSAAAAFAADRVEAVNLAGEAAPPHLADERVRMGDLHRAVWREFADAGWLTLDLPPDYRGQGLPLAVAVAVQEIFDRHCAAFGMMLVPIRSAARLIQAHAPEHVRAEWLPRLVTGEWGATICISESGAGSDVMRMTTTATPRGDGTWSITGEKQWISFGSHDLTARIGHCLLARTAGAKGLSLFLVPDTIAGNANGVAVRGIERKLGLHVSPTCQMGFEGATGWLLGEEERGLAQMFVMIANMRMSVGAMGLGIATGAADIALSYARERVQGGGPIIGHADVRRQLLELHTAVETLRGVMLTAALYADLARHETDPDAARDAAALSQWLLPIVKTLGGDTAFVVASGALQVLGGAGYTADWPVEQLLRDARVLPVFEGTTGMQGIDLLHRRLWKDEGAGLAVFARKVRADIAALADIDVGAAESAGVVVDRLVACAQSLEGMRDRAFAAEAGANAFLDLAVLAAQSWSAARLARIAGDDPATARLRALGQYFLGGAGERATNLAAQVLLGGSRIEAGADALA